MGTWWGGKRHFANIGYILEDTGERKRTEKKGGKDVLLDICSCLSSRSVKDTHLLYTYVLMRNVYIAIHHHEPVLDANQVPTIIEW